MSNYSTLKAAISAVIKENNNHEITGQVLQTTLLAMVDSLAGGYLFKGIATPATVVGTPNENVFYIGGGGVYSNFGATPVHVPDGCIGIFTYNGSFENHIIPTGGVFDISAYNAVGGTPATYANLTAALGTNGANIPEALRKGGMSVKFIQGSAQSSDNNYVKFFCTAQNFTTDVTKWQGVDDEPTAGSNNLVQSGGVYNFAKKEIEGQIIAYSGTPTISGGMVYGLGSVKAGDIISLSIQANSAVSYTGSAVRVQTYDGSTNIAESISLSGDLTNFNGDLYVNQDADSARIIVYIVGLSGTQPQCTFVVKKTSNNTLAKLDSDLSEYKAVVLDDFYSYSGGTEVSAEANGGLYLFGKTSSPYSSGSSYRYTAASKCFAYFKANGAGTQDYRTVGILDKDNNIIYEAKLITDKCYKVRLKAGNTIIVSATQALSINATPVVSMPIEEIKEGIKADTLNDFLKIKENSFGELIPSDIQGVYNDQGYIADSNTTNNGILIKVFNTTGFFDSSIKIENISTISSVAQCYSAKPHKGDNTSTYLGTVSISNGIFTPVAGTMYVLLTYKISDNPNIANAKASIYLDETVCDDYNDLLGSLKRGYLQYLGFVCAYIRSNGNITSWTITGNNVWFYNVDGVDNVFMSAVGLSAGLASWAFYNAESIGGCDETTLINSDKVSTDSTVYKKVPSGAKILAVYHNSTLKQDAIAYTVGDNITEPLFNKKIVCWGDSLTAGYGGDGTTYPKVLNSLISSDYEVVNAGVGGETTYTIAGRQGGRPFVIAESVVLPADGSDVEISLSNFYEDLVEPLRQGGNVTVNPCYVNGIECTLSITQTSITSDDYKTFLKRNAVAESAYTIPANTLVITNYMKLYGDPYCKVIFIGTNGTYTSTDDLISQIKAMIDNSTKFIVIGMHVINNTYDLAAREAQELACSKEFGAKYINLRRYLATDALSDAGITPTASDISRMAEGKCPSSLLISDTVHFNADGYTVIGKFLYKRMRDLGYVN